MTVYSCCSPDCPLFPFTFLISQRGAVYNCVVPGYSGKPPVKTKEMGAGLGDHCGRRTRTRASVPSFLALWGKVTLPVRVIGPYQPGVRAVQVKSVSL